MRARQASGAGARRRRKPSSGHRPESGSRRPRRKLPKAARKRSARWRSANRENYEVEAAGKQAINAAINTLSGAQLDMQVKLALIQALPKIIEESVRADGEDRQHPHHAGGWTERRWCTSGARAREWRGARRRVIWRSKLSEQRCAIALMRRCSTSCSRKLGSHRAGSPVSWPRPSSKLQPGWPCRRASDR